MDPSLGVPLVGGYISGDGIAIGHPVRGSQSDDAATDADQSPPRIWISCPHLDIERNVLEYPPGDPLGTWKQSLDSVQGDVWVMVVVLGRFTFTGQVDLCSPVKIEVSYGDSAPTANGLPPLILQLKSQEVSTAEVGGRAGSGIDLNSILCFPWRSDMHPKMSFSIYQAGKLFGRRLPFALNPTGLRDNLGAHSMDLPFRIQRPQNITNEVMLNHHKNGSLFGSLQLAIDFKQVPVPTIKQGGMNMFNALIGTPESREGQAPTTSPTAWVLGQPVPDAEAPSRI